MYCNKCGAYNPEERAECISCGNAFDIVDAPKRENAVSVVAGEESAGYSAASKPLYAHKPRISDYTVFSVLATIFLNKLFGIAAVIFSGMSRASLKAGEQVKAAEYSKKASMCCWLSLGLGIAGWVWWILIFFVWAGIAGALMEEGMWFFESLIYRF